MAAAALTVVQHRRRAEWTRTTDPEHRTVSGNANNRFPILAIAVKWEFWQFVIIRFLGSLTSITDY